MSQAANSPLAKTSKALFILVLKLVAVALAFSFRIIALCLTRLSELLEKASGNGSHS